MNKNFVSIARNVIDLESYNKAIGAGGEESAEDSPAEEEDPKKEESVQMTEISKDVLKAKLDVIKQQSKELKDKENALKKEPVEEELYQGEYTFGTGDIVKNINPDCEHYGSLGVVKKIMDLPNGMGKVAVYTVGNNGPTYKPGMTLTKTVDQLERYDG